METSNMELWAKILFTYGPFGLLLLFLIVAEAKARSAWKDAPMVEKMSFFGLYVVVWLVIIGLTAYSVYAWARTNLSEEAMIKGTFPGLEGSESITSTSDAGFYLRRIYKPGGKFDYMWRLISPARLPDGTKVGFTFDRSTTPDHEDIANYELTILSSFYDNSVRLQLQYDRSANKLFLIHGGHRDELQAVTALSMNIRPQRVSFIQTALAVEPFSPAEFVKRLESSDPIIRRDARTDLARYGRATLPWIQSVLTDPKSSYRLLLGVVSALNQMKDPGAGTLSSPASAAIIKLGTHEDPVMRAEVIRYVEHHPSWDLVSQFELVLADEREHAAPGVTSSRVGALALTGLQLLYNVGIVEKDRYGSRKPEDRPRLQKAIDAFAKAWSLRDLSSPKDRIVYPKALYGWGLALHDRSWIERKDGRRDPVLIKAAQQKFLEFLHEVEAAGDRKTYPYPDHLRRASAYIMNPVPQSLQ